jgi:hypothetical protein
MTGGITMTWIIICNPKFYDAERAFDTHEWVDWRQNRNIKPGDTVYVYCGTPVKELRYQCTVLESDMETSSFNDADCYLSKDLKPADRYMRLKLIKKLPIGRFKLEDLKANGLKSVQWATQASDELKNFLIANENE